MKTTTKKALYVLLDSLLVVLAVVLCVVLSGEAWSGLSLRDKSSILLFPLAAIPLFYFTGLYDAVIRYLSFKAVFTVLKSITVVSFAWGLVSWLFVDNIPNHTVLLLWMLLLVVIGGSRFLRSWQYAYYGEGYSLNKDKSNVLIYGAGTAGVQLATLLSYGSKHVAKAFIDDAPTLQDRMVEGHRVYSSDQIQHLIDKYEIKEVLLAIPSASSSRRKRILRTLEPFRVHVRSLPSIDEIVNCEVKVDDIREVDVMDLLGRDPVPADEMLLQSTITDKVVMVTGAAGSIGSELCREIVKLSPKALVLFEQHEFGLYELSNQLEHAGPKVVPVLGSLMNKALLKRVIAQQQVDTIYHAAAYKHVPIVESNPAAGLLNNVVGTLNVAQAASTAAVERFVLISTDKAVRPTNVMGASKRVAELVIQAMDETVPNVKYCAVRFGNVIGSSGSVIPRFREQIKNGGPITVTDKEVTRFFMTMPEAAQLVIQAGALGQGGDIFVLDMGSPVKIDDMARRMVRLSGLDVADDDNPNGDIAIEYTGLRAGEKLYEELLIGDNANPTRHSRILRAQEESLAMEQVLEVITQLQQHIETDNLAGLTQTLKQTVDGYQPGVNLSS